MWGLNSKVENGYKLLNSSSPVKVDGINGKDIKEIVGGYDIAFALMNYGDIYTWGANTNHVVKGQKDQMLAPVKMLISKKITSVAAGIDTILFLIK
jgi:alpha-tubulin suppressor-like RCC1 family protein